MKNNIAFFHRLADEFIPPYQLNAHVIENIGAALDAHILSIYQAGRKSQATLEQFDIIFIELSLQDPALFDFCEFLLRQRKQTSPRIIGVVEGCPFDYNHYDSGLQHRLFDLYQRIDDLFILNPQFKEHYQVFNKNIIDIGIPFPLNYTQTIPRKEPDVFTIELVNLLPDDRNTLYTLSAFEFIAGKWKQDYPSRELLGLCTTTLTPPILRRFKRLFPHVTFQQADKFWPDYFKWKKQSISLTLALDHRHALGRCVIDAAAAGIPAIGSGRSFYQQALFPERCVDIGDFTAVYQQVKIVADKKDLKLPDLSHHGETQWKQRMTDYLSQS